MRWLSYAGGAVAAGLAALAMAATARAEVFDARFSESVLLAPNGQAGTTVMAWAPDGSNRLFFARQLGQLRMVNDGALKIVKAREDGVGGSFPEGGAPDQSAAAGAAGRSGDGGAAGASNAGGAEGVGAEGGAMGAGAEPGSQGGVSSRDGGKSGAESDCGCRFARPAPSSPALAALGLLASLIGRRARRRGSRSTTRTRRAAARARRG
jgi:hypothetical protein